TRSPPVTPPKLPVLATSALAKARAIRPSTTNARIAPTFDLVRERKVSSMAVRWRLSCGKSSAKIRCRADIDGRARDRNGKDGECVSVRRIGFDKSDGAA